MDSKTEIDSSAAPLEEPKPARVVETRERAQKLREERMAKELADRPGFLDAILKQIDDAVESHHGKSTVVEAGEGFLRDAVIRELGAEGYAVRPIESDKLEVYWG